MRSQRRLATAQEGARRTRSRRLAFLAVLAGALTVPAAAYAATFVTVPPATNASGSGPFMLSFRPTATASGTAVAYQLSGGQWQRCVGGTGGITVSLDPLPDGDYQVLIADDYSPSSVPIYSGQWYACQEHDPPGTAMSVYNFPVGNPPVAQPTGPAATAATPAPAAPAPPPAQAQPGTWKTVPLPLTAAAARRYSQTYARAKWHARLPTVTSHRVSSNTFMCRVAWRAAHGEKRTRTVKVVRMSATAITVHEP